MADKKFLGSQDQPMPILLVPSLIYIYISININLIIKLYVYFFNFKALMYYEGQGSIEKDYSKTIELYELAKK